jgi:hypothetical protein
MDHCSHHPALCSCSTFYRASKILNFLANVHVNGSLTPLGTPNKPANITPQAPDVPHSTCRTYTVIVDWSV